MSAKALPRQPRPFWTSRALSTARGAFFFIMCRLGDAEYNGHTYIEGANKLEAVHFFRALSAATLSEYLATKRYQVPGSGDLGGDLRFKHILYTDFCSVY